MRHRFRWTRKSYKHAHQLARLLSRHMDLPDHPPGIVRRYWDLWERQPTIPDPLSIPLQRRLELFRGDSDIPF